MANRIKGITVEINGDTTKLYKALEGVNKNIRNTQSQLKDVEKLLKLDPSNTELLSQKHKLLADAVTSTKEKLDTLKSNMTHYNVRLLKQKMSSAICKMKQTVQIQPLQSWKPPVKPCRRSAIKSPVRSKNCCL